MAFVLPFLAEGAEAVGAAGAAEAGGAAAEGGAAAGTRALNPLQFGRSLMPHLGGGGGPSQHAPLLSKPGNLNPAS